VFGKVTSVLDQAIMIDLSGKALAIFDRSEMEADDLLPAVGDRFVARVHQDGSRGGLVVLSRKPLREEEAKPRVEQAAKDGTLIRGLVTGVIKGGVEVDIGGLRAFAPASGMDLHPQNANFVQLLGQVLDFKVIQYDAGGRDVVVTRRPMLESEAHERRKKALELLTEGQVMKGIVRTLVEWGAFVALPEAENLEGLVHVSEASHDTRARVQDLFRPGEELEVKITKIDDKGKIWLSRKALVKDPWAEARERYAPGTKHTGKITRVEKFGVFVDLGEGFEGLIHVSDLTLKKIEHPNELVKVDDPMDVVVHQFDLRDRKLSLHPAPPPEQAGEEPQRITRNGVVKAEVIRGEAAGVIVRILGVTGRGARGFIPAGQTGTVRGTDLRKKFPPGQKLDLKVIDIDPRRGEPKLSITQAAQDEERRAHREYRQQLAKEGGFGTLGDLLARKLGK
jgi:small subunit ribosomal protein S1